MQSFLFMVNIFLYKKEYQSKNETKHLLLYKAIHYTGTEISCSLKFQLYCYRYFTTSGGLFLSSVGVLNVKVLKKPSLEL